MGFKSWEKAGFESQFIKLRPHLPVNKKACPGQLNILVITGAVCPSSSRPGAQLGIDSQGLFQIVLSPHEVEKPPKAQAVCLVIFVGQLVIDIKMLKKWQGLLKQPLACKALALAINKPLSFCARVSRELIKAMQSSILLSWNKARAFN